MPPKANFIPWNEKDPMLIPHLSSSTGDTIHVAAALVLYDRLDVIVVHSGEVHACDELLNFYRRVTKTDKRVKVVYTVDEETAYKTSTLLTNPKRDIEVALAKLLGGDGLPFLRPGVVPPVWIASVQDFCVCIRDSGSELY